MAVTKFSLVIHQNLRDVFAETLLEVNKNHQLITWTRDYTDGDKDFLTLFHRTTKDLFLFGEIWGRNKSLLELTKNDQKVVVEFIANSDAKINVIRAILEAEQIEFILTENVFTVTFKSVKQAQTTGGAINILLSNASAINSFNDFLQKQKGGNQ